MPANPSSAPSGPDVARQMTDKERAWRTAEAVIVKYNTLNRMGWSEDCSAIVLRALADARREGEWQPIKTAPKDRQALFFEMYDAGPGYGVIPRVYIGMWRKADGLNRADWCDSSTMFAQPTHWMPLPQPPCQRAAQEAPPPAPAAREKYTGPLCPRCDTMRPRLHGDGEYQLCLECGYEQKRVIPSLGDA